MLLQKISLLRLSELKWHRCPDTPTYAVSSKLRVVLKGVLCSFMNKCVDVYSEKSLRFIKAKTLIVSSSIL
jgi:hypothetical protein